jgi:glycosyltransferase involved in cell wall biosynthesis
MKLLHVIDTMGAGGPSRSLLTFVQHAKRLQPDIAHRILSLGREGYPPAIFAARRMEVEVMRAPQPAEIARLIGGSDVVLLHFWNTPRVWRFLSASLAARYVVWAKVLGTTHPQVLNMRAMSSAAALVLTAPPPPDLRRQWAKGDIPIVPGIADFSRVAAVHAEPHDGFNVDYIGTLSRGKIHPGFAGIMAGIDVPGIRVRIYGGAPDAVVSDSIRRCADPARFECPGFVEDIAGILKTSDVFGYPLSSSTYATSDKSLQEAMYAGIPPVILPHGGPARFVEDGKTGLIARTEREFAHAIEYLHHNPDRRRELGANARAYARNSFAPERQAADLLKAVTAASAGPVRPILPASVIGDAALFLVSQGWEERAATAAAAAWRAGDGIKLDDWASSLPAEAFEVEGGIIHWRNTMPADPLLRWWSALWLKRQGRARDAAQEMEAARRLGIQAATD